MPKKSWKKDNENLVFMFEKKRKKNNQQVKNLKKIQVLTHKKYYNKSKCYYKSSGKMSFDAISKTFLFYLDFFYERPWFTG